MVYGGLQTGLVRLRGTAVTRDGGLALLTTLPPECRPSTYLHFACPLIDNPIFGQNHNPEVSNARPSEYSNALCVLHCREGSNAYLPVFSLERTKTKTTTPRPRAKLCQGGRAIPTTKWCGSTSTRQARCLFTAILSSTTWLSCRPVCYSLTITRGVVRP